MIGWRPDFMGDPEHGFYLRDDKTAWEIHIKEIDAESDEDFEAVIDLTNLAYNEEKNKGNKRGMAHYLYRLGNLQDDMRGCLQGSYKNTLEAKKNYVKALKIYQELDDKWSMADIYNSLACMEEDVDRAISLHESQLNVLKEADADRFTISWAYEGIALSHTTKGDYRSALSSYNTILELYKQDKSPLEVIREYEDKIVKEIRDDNARIADVYLNMGEIYAKMEEYEKAYEYFEITFGLV